MNKKIYTISSIFFLTDIISKILILTFEKKLPLKVIDNFFTIEKVTNKGGAFSILNGGVILFIIIAFLALLYIHKYLLKDVKTKLEIIAYSLLIGGILGNLFDRIFYHEVIDFLSFNIFGYMFPVFNLADIFICIGVFLIVINLFGGKYGNSSK